MNPSIHELSDWLDDKEGENLEFKEAKTSFSYERLARYCSALANEGGGRIILGVSNDRPP